MGDYVSGQKNITSVKNVNVSNNIDVNAIAQAVINALGKTNLNIGSNISSTSLDEFDTSKSLEKLAEGMVIQRDKKESNFEDLGQTKRTKKDEKGVKSTIDLLSKLED